MCIRCSGIHRSMGTHISKVRSVDLDAWTAEQLEVGRLISFTFKAMNRWGNAKVNLYWGHGLPSGHTPDEARIDQFVRAKYEHKQFAMPGKMPEPETLGTTNASFFMVRHRFF